MSGLTPQRVFETSWEVCNKVGGINTVIKSKAQAMREHYKRYTMIGPYVEHKARVEFEEQDTPKEFKKPFQELEAQGIKCRYGQWSIAGAPETILIEATGLAEQKNVLKEAYWNEHGIDSIRAGWEFEEPMLFSTAAGMLIRAYEKHTKEKRIVAQFHEWLTGFGLLHLKSKGSSVATIFTTHATMLGRAIAASGEDLYKNLQEIDPDAKSHERGVRDKHTAERASAQAADTFTTVSDITGLEAEKILGRKPDVILYNGMTTSKFPTVEETSTKHVANKERLKDFTAYYFYPYYTFDMDHTLFFFTAARYEYHNKGLDIMTAALARLNEHLKAQETRRTIVVFYWTPMGTAGVRREVIENKNAYYQIKNYMDWHGQTILKQLTWDFLIYGTRKDAEADMCQALFTREFLQDLRRDLQSFKREGNPPISTHRINDEGQNDLCNAIGEQGLTNKQEDRVKTIIYPAYLDGTDGLLGLEYYDAIVGAHLGVFPSYYEPWGYTPLESAALGVPAITTDLAGFGRFIKGHEQKNARGVWVLAREGKSYEEEVQALFEELKEYAMLDHVERVHNRLAAKTLSEFADWKHFAKNYCRAYEHALEQRGA